MSRQKRNRAIGDETSGQEKSLAELMSRYTPEQRQAYVTGLRILARLAVRAHMQWNAEELEAEQDGGEEMSE